MHSSEKYFPMHPTDFIILSRFRKHMGGFTSDYGYNKNLGAFLYNNSHSEAYYNIPVAIIDSYRYDKETGKNLRPRDNNSLGHDEVFLEPDDNLHGDMNPNRRTPVFIYGNIPSTGDGFMEFWFFFGYNRAKALETDWSHQGDWEMIKVHTTDGKITGATMSQHSGSEYYSKNDLLLMGNGTILKVYCAEGTHAFYNRIGSFDRESGVSGVAYDHTDSKGYNWDVCECVEDLSVQPWRHYAGAWGEVGFTKHTTGPLGPSDHFIDEI